MNVTFEDVQLVVQEDSAHEWVLDNAQVAIGYGVTESAVRNHKMRSSAELVEGKHFVTVTNCDGGEPKTFWTKRGVIRLGFTMRSDRAKRFRDWAEDLIVARTELAQPQNDDDILSRAVLIAQSRIQRLETENTLLLEKNTGLIKVVEQQAPKVEYVDAVLNSDGCMNTTEIAAEFSWSARRLNAELEKLGVQYKTNGHWVLTHKYKDIEQRTGHSRQLEELANYKYNKTATSKP